MAKWKSFHAGIIGVAYCSGIGVESYSKSIADAHNKEIDGLEAENKQLNTNFNYVFDVLELVFASLKIEETGTWQERVELVKEYITGQRKSPLRAENEKLREELQELSNQLMDAYESWGHPESAMALGWHERIDKALKG